MPKKPVVWVPPDAPAPVTSRVDVRSMRAESRRTHRKRRRRLKRARPGEEPGSAVGKTKKTPPASPAKTYGWDLNAAARRPDERGSEPGRGESLSVPPEIEAMAQEVIGHYDMRVSGMTLMATKPDKGGAIWRIETDRGPRSLKILHRAPPRSLFSIGAQEYLVSRGARVPALVKSVTGDSHVILDNRIWMVTNWIEGLTPATKVGLEGAQALCHGLGEFHRLSQGYLAPPGAATATRLRKWPKTYRKVLTKIGWFRVLAQAYLDMPASPVLLSMVDRFERQAAKALERLEASGYQELVARGDSAWGIVHQDDRPRGNGRGIACTEVVKHAGPDPAGDCAGPGGRLHTLVDG